MSFLDTLQKNIEEINNLQMTENGALGFRSTGKKLLDMNFRVPQYRKTHEQVICSDFHAALRENELLAVLWVFFARDIRGGLGERRLFRILFSEYCRFNPDAAIKLLPLVAEYGRWDDLIFATDNTLVWSEAVKLMKTQLLHDVESFANGGSVSLLAKWLPSERTSSKASRELARRIADLMGMPIKNYNRILVKLRKHLDVVETKMSAQEWHAINYPSVPSCANLLYKNAFLKHDETRRREYLAALQKGETKINAATLFPHDIVHKYGVGHYAWYARTAPNADETLESLWKALPDTGGLNKTIVVADGSGSMTCTIDPHSQTRALDVANGLAVYCAEHCQGVYHNKYITFSEHPQFVEFDDRMTLFDKLWEANQHDEVANTNIEAVFDIILDTAIATHASQVELPKTILIVSDMEFDGCATTNMDPNDQFRYLRNKPSSTLFNRIDQRYKDAGYQMPRLVFWNVNSRTGTIPVKENDLGVTLVSGFSLGILQMVQNGELDPYKNLVKTITSERYQPIINALLSA